MNITLTAGDATAWIRPEVGGRLGSLSVAGRELLRREDAAGDLGWAFWGAYPLVPWSNRVVGGRVVLEDETFDVPTNWPDGTAIHGLVATAPWEVEHADDRTAILATRVHHDPWALSCRSTFVIHRSELTWELAVHNDADRSVPVGLGIHPWFRHGPLSVPAAAYWPTQDCLPTGPPEPVGADIDLREQRQAPPLDVCYTGLEGASAQIAALQLRWTGPIEHVVVYAADPDWLCVEPVSNVNDPFNVRARGLPGDGLIDVAPGGSLVAVYTFDWSALVGPEGPPIG